MPENRENIVELFKAMTESNFDFNKYRITTSEEIKKLLILKKTLKKIYC